MSTKSTKCRKNGFLPYIYSVHVDMWKGTFRPFKIRDVKKKQVLLDFRGFFDIIENDVF